MNKLTVNTSMRMIVGLNTMAYYLFKDTNEEKLSLCSSESPPKWLLNLHHLNYAKIKVILLLDKDFESNQKQR